MSDVRRLDSAFGREANRTLRTLEIPDEADHPTWFLAVSQGVEDVPQYRVLFDNSKPHLEARVPGQEALVRRARLERISHRSCFRRFFGYREAGTPDGISAR